MVRTGVLGCSSVLLVVLAGHLAVAAPVAAPQRPAAADPASSAKSLFRTAEALFRAGEFAEARRHYRRAYDESALPGLLLNIAQCYRNEGDCDSARVFYSRFLRAAPASPYRSEVERVMAACRPGPTSQPAEPASAPGADALAASLGMRAPASQPAKAGALEDAGVGDPRGIPPYDQAMLNAAPREELGFPSPYTDSSIAAAPGRPATTSTRRALLWSGVALTGALVTAGAVTGGLALAKHGDWQDAPPQSEERERLRDSGRTLSTASTVTLSIAGAVGAATVLAYLLVRDGERGTPRAAVVPTEAGGAAFSVSSFF